MCGSSRAPRLVRMRGGGAMARPGRRGSSAGVLVAALAGSPLSQQESQVVHVGGQTPGEMPRHSKLPETPLACPRASLGSCWRWQQRRAALRSELRSPAVLLEVEGRRPWRRCAGVVVLAKTVARLRLAAQNTSPTSLPTARSTQGVSRTPARLPACGTAAVPLAPTLAGGQDAPPSRRLSCNTVTWRSRDHLLPHP